MTKKERRKPKSVLPSVPPEAIDLGPAWDEALPATHPEDPDSESDRITAIPDLPPEHMAERMMADESMIDSGLFGKGEGRGESQNPLHISISPETTRPGNLRPAAVPRNVSPTGLELAELDHPIEEEERTEPRGQNLRARLPSELDLEFELGPGPAAAPPPGEADPAYAEMKDRYATGDFTGALVVAEGILEARPGDHEALRCAERCRDVLMQMYATRLGPLDQVVIVAIPSDQVRWLSLDHRAGFLLSVVDGSSTIEEILDISGMNRLDALRIMYQLLDQRVIVLESGR